MRSLPGAVREYSRQLDDTPWPTVLGYAYASFMTLALLFLLTPTAWHGPIKTIGLTLPLMLLAAKDLASIPDVAIRLRALRRQDAGWPALLAACLPPGLIGMARLERDIWRGFSGWLRRKPQPARPAGLALTFLEQGAYSTVIAIGLFCVLVELPLDAAIVPLFVDDPDKVRTIHFVVVTGSVYALVWMLGDRWHLRGGQHVLTSTHLDLRVGARASARIPRDAIEDVQRLAEPVARWRRTHPFRLAEALTITPWDKPNLVLRLRPNAGCTIRHHGIERTAVRYVFLYLDCPERLLAALGSASQP
ncbi:MAG: hypothetical protein AB1807_25180 [Pseudomonadota bacterium]